VYPDDLELGRLGLVVLQFLVVLVYRLEVKKLSGFRFRVILEPDVNLVCSLP
jgi:hypothetical protein